MFFAASPRAVAPDLAGRLAAPARGRARIVAVTVDADDASLERIMRELRPDLIQLHGRETPSRAREIALRTGAGVIKTLPVSIAGDIDAARAFDGLVEHLMFEGKPAPDAERPGGAGQVFDWSLLSGRRFERPHFLAGGLDPWNVAEAVQQSGAPMVDVSSGVERGAGLKDPGLISAFLDAARRA
jgi:phosphoribosylanthranilate isomerase